jgi:hypothetical protein
MILPNPMEPISHISNFNGRISLKTITLRDLIIKKRLKELFSLHFSSELLELPWVGFCSRNLNQAGNSNE